MTKARRIAALIILIALAGVALYAAGEAQVRETEKRGKVTRREWVDENGQAVAGPEGYAAVTFTYDKTTVTEYYSDTAGQPYRMPGGYYGKTSVYGTAKRLTDVIYLDEAGNTVMNASGYAHVRMVYNAMDAIKTLSYFNADEKLTVVPHLGYAIQKNEYRNTTLIKQSFYDNGKNLTDCSEGFAVMIREQNKKGQIIAVRYTHADGTPAECRDGWASCERELDRAGRLICEKYYDAGGRLTDRGMVYAYEKKQYDADGGYTVSRYAADGSPVPIGDGYMSLKRETDGKGSVMREIRLDANGTRTAGTDGISAVAYTYDALGRLTGADYEDLTGGISLNDRGYAGYRDTLDADGFVVSRILIGMDGDPVNASGGYSEIRYEYNELKETVQIRYFSTDGVQVR